MRTTILSVVIVFLSLGAVAAHSAEPSQEPAQQPAVARPRFPSPQRDSLLNGLQIAVVNKPAAKAVAINLTFNGGATYDLAGKAGLASLTSELLVKGGTEGLSSTQIQQIFETDAPDFQVTADWDSISFTATVKADRIALILDTIGKMIAGPKFGLAELEAAKKARLQRLQSTLSDPAREAALSFDATLYGSYPYGHTIEGSVESTSAIGRGDVYNYYKRFFIANNATLITVGNSGFDETMSAARAGLGRLLMGSPVPATFKPPQERSAPSVLLLDRQTLGDSYLHLGGIGVSRGYENYYAMVVLNRLLGEGAHSRLVQRISTEKNYTQLISSRFEARALGGPYVINAVAPAAAVPKIIDESLAAMEKLRTELVPASELALVKRQIVDEYPLRFETDAQIAARLAELEVYDLGRDYIVAFQDRIFQVSAEQVRTVAQQVLTPQKVLIVVAGPAAELKTTLSKFGTVAVEPVSASAASPARAQDK